MLRRVFSTAGGIQYTGVIPSVLQRVFPSDRGMFSTMEGYHQNNVDVQYTIGLSSILHGDITSSTGEYHQYCAELINNCFYYSVVLKD